MTRRVVSPCLLAVLTLAGCSTAGATVSVSTSPTPASTASSSPSSTTSPSACPNDQGGSCLGPLQAGTYHTVVFHPQITYTVPAGWENDEDTPGNFLLVPPGGSLAGVNAGTSDYLGVYSGVAAEMQDCSGEVSAPGVGTAPGQIAAYWAGLPTIKVTAPRAVTIGGLSGVVVDIVANLARNAICPDPSSSWGYQPLIVGVGPASLEHGLIKTLSLRIYLLTWSAQGQKTTSTIAIEIDDLNGGSHLNAYSLVSSTFKFSS
jgi:hypothetical protein